MIRNWGASAVIHNGDFDYNDSPRLWVQQIDEILGPNFPYFATIGNHDLVKWKGKYGYKHLMIDRLYRTKLYQNCRGDYGVNMECNKRDETGYEIYEICRKYGALVATAHEHSYSRTHLMSNFESQKIESMNSSIQLRPGHSFAFVNGIGGEETRPWQNGMQNHPWWAAAGSSDNGISFGAMLCEFHINGQPNKAQCQFQDIDGKIWDDFDITSHPKEPAPTDFHRKPKSHYREYPVASHDDVTLRRKIVKKASSRHSLYNTSFKIAESAPDYFPIAKSCNNEAYEKNNLTRGSDVTLRFQGVKEMAAYSTKRLQNAHLQILVIPGSSHVNHIKSEKTVHLSISVRPAEEVVAERTLTISIQAPLSEFETGEIWVSPDISPLFTTTNGLDVLKNGLSLDIRGCVKKNAMDNTIDEDFEISAYSWGEKGCFAPTLVFQTLDA
ncbi:uncharacterized protein VTP21DRAFT_11572 [Calcarisporiella thermophila]|uniref:uncharacterized protein n=1 Tax=Calcarisporiella thermophila TaxID=911321 RepID=UPI00374438ED